MKYLLLTLLITTSNLALAIPPDANINDVVLNELLFNPGPSVTPSDGQDCNGNGTPGQDGISAGPPISVDAEDEFIEFYNNGATDVDLEGYCISNNAISGPGTAPSADSRWLIPSGVIVPANGFYYICGGTDIRSFGFSIADTNGDDVAQFSNNSGTNTFASLYEPTTPGICGSGVQTVIFSEDYGDGESNGEPYLRCFVDGTGPLGFYLNDDGDFSVPSPGAPNCTVSTPVYINHIKHSGNEIKWQAGLEFNHLGYNVYAIGENKTIKLNSKLIQSDKSKQYSFQIEDQYQHNKLLLTAVDAFGVEQKLDRIKPNQSLGLKEILVKINWNKTTPKQNNHATNNSTSINVLVDQSGIQKISVQDLVINGLDIVGLTKKKIQLKFGNKIIPFYLKSKSKQISILDSIVFLADKADSIYSNQSIYTLTISENNQFIKSIKAAPRKGVKTASFYMETKVIEDNINYEISSPTTDPWMMKRMLAVGQANTETWQIQLPYLAKNRQALNQPITFSAYLNGVTNFPGVENDHHMVFQVNNKSTDIYFDGLESVEITNQLANLHLNQTFNISLIQPADTNFIYDLVNLDKFTISYPRNFSADSGTLDFESNDKQFLVDGFNNKDLIVLAQNSRNTQLLKGVNIEQQGEQYSVNFYNSTLQSHIYIAQWDSLNKPTLTHTVKPPMVATDYLIVTQKDLLPNLNNYIINKRAQGLKVTIIDVESIYSHYGTINSNPESIKSYINTLNDFHPLSNVMIVGSDQYDYKNYLNTDAFSVVPTFYRHTGDGIFHAPTDAPFVDFNNDNIADIAIGRLTVNNSDELDNILGKINSYQANNFDKEVYLTDNIDAANFNAIADHLSLRTATNIQIINSEQLGVAQANNDLIDAVNNGTDFVNWIGHSSASRWSRDNIFDINDVNGLINPPTVFFQLGCWNSYFVDPIKQSLAGTLIQKQNHGATATIGSSTYTKTDGERMLAQYFKDYINNHATATIGQAFNYAIKQYAILNPDRNDILLGYQLLGDPTMRVK